MLTKIVEVTETRVSRITLSAPTEEKIAEKAIIFRDQVNTDNLFETVSREVKVTKMSPLNPPAEPAATT